MNKFITLFFVVFFMGVFFHGGTQAQTLAEKKDGIGSTVGHFDYQEFARLPILHNGRLKPMDSVARLFAQSFSGTETPQGKPAIEWFAEALFHPEKAELTPIYKIRNAKFFGLEEGGSRLYTYAEVSSSLEKKSTLINHLLQIPEEEWPQFQREMMDIYSYTILHDQILHSLTALLPLPMPIPKALGGKIKKDSDQNQQITLMDYYKYDRVIKESVIDLLNKKGEDYTTYSPEEMELARFAIQIDMLRQGAEFNDLFRVIPSEWKSADSSREWFSPWIIIESGQGGPKSVNLFGAWQRLSKAYVDGNASEWQASVAIVKEVTLSQANEKEINLRFELEILYNKIHPFILALALYFISLLLIGVRAITGRKIWVYGAITALVPAIALHGSGILLRVLILDRPPVGTLYESILFVALICVSGGFMIIRKSREIALLTAAGCGTILLFIAEAFATDDTMKMLMAVLNTNFWLATHVLCITIGYGWCLLASFLAHIYLFGKAFPSIGENNKLEKLDQTIRVIAMLALLFTTLGTILGGIWADQSWGRFWGWDPKENGALAIVIWIAWLLHTRIGRYIDKNGWAVGIALLSVVVSLAWFGVNLLGVGLHSYGFESGIIWGLGLFCFTEIVFLSYLWLRILGLSKKEK